MENVRLAIKFLQGIRPPITCADLSSTRGPSSHTGTHATATARATPSGPPALISHIYSGQRARRQESTRAHLMLHINTSICAAQGLSRLEAGMRAPFSSPCPAGSKQFCQRGCCSLSTRLRAQKLWLTRRLSLTEMHPVSAPHGTCERSCTRADLLWKSQTEGPQREALPLNYIVLDPIYRLHRVPPSNLDSLNRLTPSCILYDFITSCIGANAPATQFQKMWAD